MTSLRLHLRRTTMLSFKKRQSRALKVVGSLFRYQRQSRKHQKYEGNVFYLAHDLVITRVGGYWQLTGARRTICGKQDFERRFSHIRVQLRSWKQWRQITWKFSRKGFSRVENAVSVLNDRRIFPENCKSLHCILFVILSSSRLFSFLKRCGVARKPKSFQL